MEEKKKRKSYPEYTTNYVKKNYKRIELRIKLDNERVLNHLASMDNVSNYILNLIEKDIGK